MSNLFASNAQAISKDHRPSTLRQAQGGAINQWITSLRSVIHFWGSNTRKSNMGFVHAVLFICFKRSSHQQGASTINQQPTTLRQAQGGAINQWITSLRSVIHFWGSNTRKSN